MHMHTYTHNHNHAPPHTESGPHAGGSGVCQDEGYAQYEYAREALKRGLAYESKLGANPFKFGMIGSTDAHGGLASTEESNWWGKANVVEPSPERYRALGKGTDFAHPRAA